MAARRASSGLRTTGEAFVTLRFVVSRILAAVRGAGRINVLFLLRGDAMIFYRLVDLLR
jgi:hypothetical protein